MIRSPLLFLINAFLSYTSNFKHILVKKFITPKIKNIGIFVPGYDVPSEDYISLCESIIEQAENKKLYVDIVISRVNSPTQEDYEKSIDDVLDYIKNTYDPDSYVFMMGHSIGSSFSREKAGKKCNMMINLGSVFNSQNIYNWKSTPISTFPKPALTILGENDGFIKHTMASYEFDNLNKLISNLGYEYAAQFKPVVILPEINHMQMASERVTETAKLVGLKDLDLENKISLKEAHANIAEIIVDFLNINLKNNNASSVNMVQNIKRSHSLVSNYIEYVQPEFLSDIISDIQKRFINGDFLNVYNNWNYDLTDFLYSKPFFYNNTIITQSFINTTLDFQKNPFFNALFVKLKNNDAINQFLNVTFLENVNSTAQEINAFIFNSTFEKLSPQQQKNYIFFGKKLTFGPDIITQPGPNLNWVETDIQLTKQKNIYILQSPTMFTNTSVLPKRFAGMYYIKVITPAQVVDWVTFHSLK